MIASSFQSERAAVILAGGDSTRLCALTRELFGEEIPKQFCRLWDQHTLLEHTRRRAALLVDPARTLTVLTESHARFYRPLLEDMSGEQVAVQPANRGTAPAILYAVMRLKKSAPDCAVAMFPSDHFVGDDREFMRNVEAASVPSMPAPKKLSCWVWNLTKQTRNTDGSNLANSWPTSANRSGRYAAFGKSRPRRWPSA